MPISKPSDLLKLNIGDLIQKNLFVKLIEGSRDVDSPFFENELFQIYGQYYRGLNWIGCYPSIKAVIAKSILPQGNNYDDKYLNEEHTKYQYFYQTLGNDTNLNHQHNLYLDQQRFNKDAYQIILLRERPDKLFWRFEGKFDVCGTNRRIGHQICCELIKRA